MELSDKTEEKSTVRYRIVKGKRRPLCDYQGKCENLAYREVYPFILKKHGKNGWSYLCRKHFEQEKKKFKGKVPYSSV